MMLAELAGRLSEDWLASTFLKDEHTPPGPMQVAAFVTLRFVNPRRGRTQGCLQVRCRRRPDEGAIRAEMVRNITAAVQIAAKGRIVPAVDVLNFEHRFSCHLLIELCLESPTRPRDMLPWAAGLAMGFNLEFGPAIAILVPRLEHVIRVLVKERGVDTPYVDGDGAEPERA